MTNKEINKRLHALADILNAARNNNELNSERYLRDITAKEATKLIENL